MHKKPPIVIALTLMALGCLMFGASIIYCFLLPKSYKATVTIQVKGQPWDGNGGSIFEPHFFPTEAETIQSKIILYQVISNLNLNQKWADKRKDETELRIDLTYTMLKGRIEIRQPRNTGQPRNIRLIQISAWSEAPAESAAIANEIARVHCESRRASRRQMIEGGIRVLEAELEKPTRLIPEARALVERLRQELNISAMDDRTGSVASLPSDDKRRPYFVAKEELEIQQRLKARIDQDKRDALIGRPIEIIDAAEPPSRATRPNRVAGAALLVMGLVSLLTGFLLLVMSQREPSPAEPQFSDA